MSPSHNAQFVLLQSMMPLDQSQYTESHWIFMPSSKNSSFSELYNGLKCIQHIRWYVKVCNRIETARDWFCWLNQIISQLIQLICCRYWLKTLHLISKLNYKCETIISRCQRSDIWIQSDGQCPLDTRQRRFKLKLANCCCFDNPLYSLLKSNDLWKCFALSLQQNRKWQRITRAPLMLSNVLRISSEDINQKRNISESNSRDETAKWTTEHDNYLQLHRNFWLWIWNDSRYFPSNISLILQTNWTKHLDIFESSSYK